MEQGRIDFLLYAPKSILLNYEIRGRIKIDKVLIKAYIHSNEITGHNRPHVHVVSHNKDYECSIDDKIQIIKPDNCSISESKKICSIISIPENLRKCRLEWNRCETLVKFEPDDFNFSNKYIKREGNYFIIATLK